jgi:hypothetical protein
MTPRRIPTLITFALAAGVATVFFFGMYTTPNHGGPAYGDLEILLERALGDSATPLPGPPRGLPVQSLGADSGPAGTDWPPSPESDSAPAAWLAAAVAADRDAIRAWLGPAVLATSTTVGDTVRTVLWRLSLHRGCPFVSRLDATSVGRATRSTRTRFIDLGSSCPGPSSR